MEYGFEGFVPCIQIVDTYSLVSFVPRYMHVKSWLSVNPRPRTCQLARCNTAAPLFRPRHATYSLMIAIPDQLVGAEIVHLYAPEHLFLSVRVHVVGRYLCLVQPALLLKATLYEYI